MENCIAMKINPFKQQVQVEFYDADTNELLGIIEKPAKELPDTFEIETTLHLNDSDWKVISANPPDKESYILQQVLQLYIRRQLVKAINVEDINYTVITINDALPEAAVNNSVANNNLLLLHEDDWRQIEFVHQSFRLAIDKEIEAIHNIYVHHSKLINNNGLRAFNRLHIRKHIVYPLLPKALSLMTLYQAFPLVHHHYEGFIFNTWANIVSNSFAFETEGGLTFYGIAKEDRVEVLGLTNNKLHENTFDTEIGALQQLLEKCELYLVDWCKETILSGQIEHLQAWFKEQND